MPVLCPQQMSRRFATAAQMATSCKFLLYFLVIFVCLFLLLCNLSYVEVFWSILQGYFKENRGLIVCFSLCYGLQLLCASDFTFSQVSHGYLRSRLLDIEAPLMSFSLNSLNLSFSLSLSSLIWAHLLLARLKLKDFLCSESWSVLYENPD